MKHRAVPYAVQSITEIIDSSGNGAGNDPNAPYAIAVDAARPLIGFRLVPLSAKARCAWCPNRQVCPHGEKSGPHNGE